MVKDLFDRALGLIARRRTCYVSTFKGPLADEVLADLAKFCRATQSTFHPDSRIHTLMEGRREVWLRISQHLNLTDEELLRLYGQINTSQQ